LGSGLSGTTVNCPAGKIPRRPSPSTSSTTHFGESTAMGTNGDACVGPAMNPRSYQKRLAQAQGTP
jgi:hypothetical protein